MLKTLNCRLPVKLARWALDDRAASDADQSTLPGFLDLASGRFVSDREAEIIDLSPLNTDNSLTVSSPTLRGWLGISYSWPARRWLPASLDQVAQDGLHYAYPEIARWSNSNPPITNADIRVHVVDVRAATDQVISTGPGWGILGYRSDGIYVTKTRYNSGESNSGIWKMDVATGSTQQLLPESATTLRLGGAAAWGSESPMMPAILFRYDLTSGAHEVWYTRLNYVVVYLATDSTGQPLVRVFKRGLSSDTGELWLLAGPNNGTLIYSGSDFLWPGSSDSRGLWLHGRNGLWLLQSTGKLLHVTTAQVQALGDCR